MKRFAIICAIILSMFSCCVGFAQAKTITLVDDINVDAKTAQRGITLKSFDGNFFIGIAPKVLTDESRVVIKQFDKSLFTFPEYLEPISDVYEFDVINKLAFQNKPLSLKFKTAETRNLKKIYIYNSVNEKWEELASQSVTADQIKANIKSAYAKMAILATKEKLEFGEASWYKYKGCDCAASPDYPKGTMLKVTNMDNNKTVTVKVNDYGPDGSIFPKRIIDLDKTAFIKIGELWRGVLKNIKVEKL